jgi:hypothetical protein
LILLGRQRIQMPAAANASKSSSRLSMDISLQFRDQNLDSSLLLLNLIWKLNNVQFEI